MSDANLPANVREFSEITGVVFGQLYESFPVRRDLDIDEIAKSLGLPVDGEMPSGRRFREVVAHTLSWLVSEGFIQAAGAHPRERVVLITKALAAMNVVPPQLGQRLGPQLADAAKQASSDSGRTKVAELIGTLLGSFTGSATKAIGGG